MAGEDVLGQSAGRLVEPEPPRRPSGEKGFRAREPSDDGLDDRQAANTTGMRSGQRERGCGAEVQSDDVRRGHLQDVEKSHLVEGETERIETGVADVGGTDPAQIGCHHVVPGGHQSRLHPLPHSTGVREAVQKQHRLCGVRLVSSVRSSLSDGDAKALDLDDLDVRVVVIVA